MPLKFFDVTKTTHTNLGVLQEKRINDLWNVNGIQPCQIHGQDSRSVRCRMKNLLKGICCPAGDSQRFKQQPDLIVCVPILGQEGQKPLRR